MINALTVISISLIAINAVAMKPGPPLRCAINKMSHASVKRMYSPDHVTLALMAHTIWKHLTRTVAQSVFVSTRLHAVRDLF